jgi:nucleotide-binding universal stress UspA family protein
MKVLVPIDGSDCSTRALSFAVEFAHCFDATLDVVHFSDAETDATDEICDRAAETIPDDVACTIRVLTDEDLDFRPADRVGEIILELVESDGYDHVVMGHHGDGVVGRAILGSAAEKVVRAETVPVTIVP